MSTQVEQTVYPHGPVRVLKGYSVGRAGANEVMRALTTHRGWFVPVTLFARGGGPQPRTADSVLVLGSGAQVTAGELWVFTDREAALRAQAAGAQLGAYAGGIGGVELFRSVPTGTAVVRVNPGSPVEETWTLRAGGGIEAGYVWADAVSLEESFGVWEQTGKPDEASFVRYRAFLTLDHPTGQVVTLPGHAGMTNPAAAFTAPDCLEAFMARLGEGQREGLRAATVAGGTLLSRSKALGIDGLVINLFGPGAAYALPFSSFDTGI